MLDAKLRILIQKSPAFSMAKSIRLQILQYDLPQIPSFTLEDGKSSARYPLFSQKKRPLGQADVPTITTGNFKKVHNHVSHVCHKSFIYSAMNDNILLR